MYPARKKLVCLNILQSLSLQSYNFPSASTSDLPLKVLRQKNRNSPIISQINSLTTNVPYIETSQLICISNNLTGFYMMGNIGH